MPTCGPSFPIRVTDGQLQSLNAGLKSALWATLSQRAMSPEGLGPCVCAFCQFSDALVALAHSLRELDGQQRYRLRLNLVQILICQLALRNSANPPRAVRCEFDCDHSNARTKQLAAKLENLRKCAKRGYQQLFGLAAYTELRATWCSYLDCLRQKLSGRPLWFLRRHKPQAPRLETIVIDSLIGSVTPKLRELQSELPDSAQPRKLTRLFLRYIRRGRIDVSLRDCLCRPDVVAAELAPFIQTHIT